MSEKTSYIQFLPTEKTVMVKVGYPLLINKDEEGFINYYIPGFNLFFSVTDEERAKPRASAMVKAFIDFWILKNGPREFFLEIHKLGFRSPNHNFIMKEFLNKKITKSKFKTEATSKDNFEDGEILDEEYELVT